MSDYKRFISYLYCYENGIKKSNIGYARVETRNGQCKITIHIKLLSLANKVLDTYLFYRRDQKILGLPLCPLTIKSSVGDCQALISLDKVLGTALPFSMMGGIIIPVSPTLLLGTEWDDSPILPSAFVIAEASPEAAVEEPEAKAAIAESEPEAAIKEPELEAAAAEASPMPEAFHTIRNYLLIDPAYIDHLSAEYAGLKQNSFVLNGYSSYRHLILAKWLISSPAAAVTAAEAAEGTEGEEPEVFYQLGVPGIYSAREKQIAEKFGFAEFKTTKASPLKYGDFGYWLVPVTF